MVVVSLPPLLPSFQHVACAHSLNPPSPNVQAKLHSGQVHPRAVELLIMLGGQCAAYNFAGANKTQMDLVTVDWPRTKEWHKGVRAIVNLACIKTAR